MTLSFSAIKAPGALAFDTDYIGIVDGPLQYTDYLENCDRIIASGAKWTRIGMTWNSIETSKGVYNSANLAKLDAAIDKLYQAGVNDVFILAYTANWASSMPSDPYANRYKPANWSDWEDFVSFVTNRYKGKIKYWEVWNEPDHPSFWKSSIADYETLLEKAYAKVKETDATNTVLLGGLALYDGTTFTYGLGTFFDTLMGMGAGNYFDITNYHSYGKTTNMIAEYNGMMDVINKYSIQGKPVWITEMGITTTDDYYKGDMVDQIYQLNKTLLPNVSKIFWYNYRDTVTGNSSEDNYGLVNNDLTTTHAYYNYQALNGAASNFAVQLNQASYAANALTLYYVPATSGDGSYVVNYGTYAVIPKSTYMYFRINDNWLYDTNGGLDCSGYVDITYLDSGTGNFYLQYDGTGNSYTSVTFARTNTGQYKTVTAALTDLKYANRQNNQADFRISAGGSNDLNISSVVVRKESMVGRCILDTNNRYKYLQQYITTDPNQEAYTTTATMGGIACRQIGNTNNKYFYMQAASALSPESNTNVTIRVKYYDAGTDKITVQYCSTANTYKGVNIQKTNTNTWIWKDLVIADAKFNKAQSYNSDFRIGNGYDGSYEYIAAVEVIKN